MTEADWLSCSDPDAMLQFLEGKASQRKLPLFCVACCRHLLTQIKLQSWDVAAVDVAERFADGNATAAELETAAAETSRDWTGAFACADAARISGGVAAASDCADNAAYEVGEQVAAAVENYDDDNPIFRAARDQERRLQSALLRDIAGDVFRLQKCESRWLSTNVLALAEAIYSDRAFDRLPILADALEDAGCTDADILDHCRQPVEHVRGCWVVDLLLNRR
jgi:hypothetical protein